MFKSDFLFRNYKLLRRKSGLSELFSDLNINFFGEDAGAINLGDRFLLMSADGIMPEIVKADPEFAGMSSVLVTINDIQAMGGYPEAIVNVISADRKTTGAIVRGMQYAARKAGVKILGGHYHPTNNTPHLSIASLGHAIKIIRSNNAKAGDNILIAIDMNGRLKHKKVIALDSFSSKSKKKIKNLLKIMPYLGEKGLINSAKDISNAGIIGTIAIILELSKKGGIVDSELIPWNTSLPLNDWLKVYPAYGFIITAKPENTPEIISLFKKHNITCSVIGVVTSGHKLKVRWHGVYHTVADWKKKRIF